MQQDEEDGDWIAPLVPNPKCEDVAGCGPWTQPKIRNPEYKVSLLMRWRGLVISCGCVYQEWERARPRITVKKQTC